MEKRIFGIILTLLGIGGLIYAAISITHKSSSVSYIAVYGILGLIFFLTGVSLLRNTNDRASGLFTRCISFPFYISHSF